jgi:hypothetical protein
LDIVRLFFVIFQNATPPWRRGKAIHTKQFQNGTLARRCARVHRMATPAMVVGRFPVSTRDQSEVDNNAISSRPLPIGLLLGS